MPTYFILNDAGDAAVLNGDNVEKVGLVAGVPNYTTTGGDTLNISSWIFSNTTTAFSQWTAGQNATRVQQGWQGISKDVASVSGNAYTAPYNGEMRFYYTNPDRFTNLRFAVRVNGVKVMSIGNQAGSGATFNDCDSPQNAAPLAIGPGQVVSYAYESGSINQFGQSYIVSYFMPYQWPQP